MSDVIAGRSYRFVAFGSHAVVKVLYATSKDVVWSRYPGDVNATRRTSFESGATLIPLQIDIDKEKALAAEAENKRLAKAADFRARAHKSHQKAASEVFKERMGITPTPAAPVTSTTPVISAMPELKSFTKIKEIYIPEEKTWFKSLINWIKKMFNLK